MLPRCSAYCKKLKGKGIRFRHPDYDLDRAQKLISLSMSRHLSTCKMSSKFNYAFLSNLDNTQTDRQTDRHRGQSHLPPPLSEVINSGTVFNHLSSCLCFCSGVFTRGLPLTFASNHSCYQQSVAC